MWGAITFKRKMMENDIQDPTLKLEEAKLEIQQKLTHGKLLLKQQQKDLRTIEKSDGAVFTDKNDRIIAKSKEIQTTIETITELEFDLKSLSRTKDDENEEKIQAALFKVAEWLKKNQSVSYVIDRDDFVYVTNYSTSDKKPNVLFRTVEPNKFIKELALTLQLKAWHLPVPRVIDLFNSVGKTFHMSRFSIDERMWNDNKIYLPIKHMEQYFINNDVVEEQGYSEYFDWLMYSLSGGKRENVEHLERWIVHKVINYRKAVTTPDLVVVGHVGGNGKGILQAMVRLMFPATLSGKANTKTLNGNFNAIMLGKLVVFFDDQETSEIPLEVVKQLAGAESMIFEEKGKDQYEGEKTHSSAWFSNKLPFKLTPAGKEGGVDRRFSIMRTNITYLESIRIHYPVGDGHEITIEECKDVAENIVRDYLINRVELARWFKELQRRYPEIDENYTLKPLHGEDYRFFLEQQSNTIDQIWEKLVIPTINNGGCIPVFVIKELIRHLGGENWGDKRLVAQIKQISAEGNLDIVLERHSIDITPSNMSSKKQCVVIRPRDGKKWLDHSFDWSTVSRSPYKSGRAAHEQIITEDDLCFGAVADDIDINDEVDDMFVYNEQTIEEKMAALKSSRR